MTILEADTCSDAARTCLAGKSGEHKCCSDGGSSSAQSTCALGTDTQSCGKRYGEKSKRDRNIRESTYTHATTYKATLLTYISLPPKVPLPKRERGKTKGGRRDLRLYVVDLAVIRPWTSSGLHVVQVRHRRLLPRRHVIH